MKRIHLTESQLYNLIRQSINEGMMNGVAEMDQYSEFNFEELAQHIKEDLADYGVNGVIDASQFYDEDEIIIELSDGTHIYLIFEFNDDGSVRCVDVEMDVENRAIIRIMGTPMHEKYFLGKGEEFDYDILLSYIEKVISTYQGAMTTESIVHFVVESIKKKFE